MTLILDRAPAFLSTGEREDIRVQMAGLKSSAPALLTDDRRDGDQAEWPIALAVVGAVAAVSGLALTTVAYICSVCQARSFDACLRAVQRYFGAGC